MTMKTTQKKTNIVMWQLPMINLMRLNQVTEKEVNLKY